MDKEGFSLEAYKYIKNSNEIQVIANLANASLYNIRNMLNIFSIDARKLIPIPPE